MLLRLFEQVTSRNLQAYQNGNQVIQNGHRGIRDEA